MPCRESTRRAGGESRVNGGVNFTQSKIRSLFALEWMWSPPPGDCCAAGRPQKNGKAPALHTQNEGLPGARSVKRAGSAVELRPAPKARIAAHP
jgi:hypothetical protein